MKLLYQLNAAFTALLIIIMSVTAFFIYSLLLDILIQDQQDELQTNGNLILNFLYEDPSGRGKLSRLIESNDYKILIMDPDQNSPLATNLPETTARSWASEFETKDEQKGLRKMNGENYVVSKLGYRFQGQEYLLILATPVEELQAIQSIFAVRMMIVFVIGIAIAILFSYLLTKRLVTPLSRLKREVKKIENRQFNEIKPVNASGEIGEVEQSVMDMAKELDQYIRSQKHFFQNASHELKTPLMTIQGYAEGVKDGVFEGEAADRSLDLIVKESDRLKKIVNEIILLAKLDSEDGIYNPVYTSVPKLFEDTKERMYFLASEKGVSLNVTVKEDRQLYVDEEKMLQALINIVGNGIRHAASEVNLRAYEANGQLVLEIEDDGDGVPEELLPQLFHRFVKGKEGETGLGLAISRAIVERSQGTIHVSNKDQGGAVFRIVFPSSASQANL
ncbi:histidine kinase [Pontibacillus chungwhensis BH030062]|uniref:histidine kinase n=1 Tax=Pontibacillus chungwhensis BH030062 TaxID=1385513 RepID=A0A0A2VG09_9BACI|nr:HAMP domain-containing sensor histidine kinase [Pontibacillus chungwhensis]KGP92570.1 histidine kinase [Pontibacillus chungwhensis BH030062]